MIIEVVCSGPVDTNAFLIGCEETSRGIIVDPSEGSAPVILELIKKYRLDIDAIYLTHSHWDHLADLAILKKHFKIPVFVHILDAENVRHPGSDGLPLMMEIEGVEPDGYFEEGHHLNVGNLKFDVIHTPGHTPGGVCFYFRKDHILLSGDTLFQGSIGNLSFPTADPDLMWASLKKLALLPKQTEVYSGHGEPTTIADEHWLDRAEEIFGEL